MTRSSSAVARRMMAGGSRSFWLASRLLGTRARDDAAVLYAYCRRADDAVDLCAAGDAPAAVRILRAELEVVYSDRVPDNPLLAAFQQLVEDRGIPRAYPEALLDGMAMDAAGTQYRTLADLLLYCYRVAGTVGLMMCHIMGVRDDRALVRAVHLGVAMQLTNICRDVAEDWSRGRLYLPRALLVAHGAIDLSPTGDRLPQQAIGPIAGVVRALLARADSYYRSGERGIDDLPVRAGLAVRAARLIYSRIGAVIAARGHDVTVGRAVVSGMRKVALLLRALAIGVVGAPWSSGDRPRLPAAVVLPTPELFLIAATEPS